MTVMTQKKVSMREKKACCYVNVGWCFYTPWFGPKKSQYERKKSMLLCKCRLLFLYTMIW
jgi:hypothetical protein